MKKVAFCLVENEKGRVLMVRRAYGSKKGKWSLPGGFVDRGERRDQAARREVKEETGIIVELTYRLFTSRSKESAIFAGKQVGGELRYQRKECLDVRWWDLGKIELSELAFGGDRKAILMWRGMKAGQVEPEYDLRGFRG